MQIATTTQTFTDIDVVNPFGMYDYTFVFSEDTGSLLIIGHRGYGQVYYDHQNPHHVKTINRICHGHLSS